MSDSTGRGTIRQPGHDDIDEFKARALAFCNAQAGRTTHLAIAKTKLEEMVYYLRRHREAANALAHTDE
jgi:hypothetical protein